MRLKPKLIASFLLASLAPMGLLGYLNYWSARDALKRQTLNDLTLVAEAKEGHLYGFLEAVKGRAVDFASDGFIREHLEAMKGLDPKSPRFIGLQRALGRHLKNNKQPLDRSIRSIGVIDTKGRIVGATSDDDLGIDESKDAYFIEGRSAVYVSDVHDSLHKAAGKGPHVAAAAPILGMRNGAPLGAIVNFYDTRDLDKVLSGEFQTSQGAQSGMRGRMETIDIYLVNKDGLLITPSRLGGDVMKQRVETLPVTACGFGWETTSAYRNHLDRDVLGAAMCIGGKGWTLIAEIDAEEAFKPILELRNRMVVLGVGVALIVLAASYLIGLRISRPVAALSRVTRAIAGGDLRSRASAESRDEIGELALSFNKMTESLAESRQAILEEKSRLEELIRDVKEGVCFIDAAGNVALINKSIEESLGIRSEDVVGKPATEWSWAVENIGEILSVVKDGKQPYYAGEAVCGGRQMEITASPIRSNGSSIGTVIVFRDVTDRKRLEEEARQSQKIEAVGRLAGGIAHDFNNLLTVILGYTQLLLRRLAPADEMRPDVEVIDHAADRAAALTRQLLAFSRKQILAPAVLDLNGIVSGLTKMIRRIIGEDVDLVTVLAPDLGAVKADPGQVEQIIMNLVVNARDAMPQGGRLTIETANASLDGSFVHAHAGAAAGSYVMLAISDTGAGMDAETRSRIFEPFFTTKEVGKGTGLGLSMVYGVVKQSEGYIDVESAPGRGATFRIYLPRVEETAESAPAAGLPAAARAGGETILLAEDDPTVREFSARVLRGLGYTVLDAADGKEAVLILSRYAGKIHLLLTDVVMPGMSGGDLAARAASIRPGTKVLFMSGYTDDTVVRHGVLESEIAFLTKPFAPEELARKVREVLEE